MFRYNLSVPSSSVKYSTFFSECLTLENERRVVPTRRYTAANITPRNIPEERSPQEVISTVLCLEKLRV
jgi:hypothetical protein